MKNTLNSLMLVTILAIPLPAYAADQTDKGVQPEQAASNVSKFDERLLQAQKNMKKMREQMAEIQKTQDPQAQQKLLQDYWATMNDMMGVMYEMWGAGMMGMMNGLMMGWNHMGDYYSRLTPEQMKQHQHMMEQYMGVQQMMMDNMMQHQNCMMQGGKSTNDAPAITPQGNDPHHPDKQ